MICVTIARPHLKEALATCREAARLGAGLVELRIDHLEPPPSPGWIPRDRPRPLLVACRRPEDGGRFRGTEVERLSLLRDAVTAGVEYVDIELDVAAELPRSGTTRRIVSYHDFRRVPDELAALHAQMCLLDPDVVKIAALATHPSDNVRMLELVARATVPTVAFCMGELGKPSRVLAGRFGAPFTYAAPERGRAVAPGQLSFADLRDTYGYERIGPRTELFGLIGDPVGHSLGPLLHNTVFRALDVDAVYLPWRVPRGLLPGFLRDVARLQPRGFSVTLPHKESAVALARDADEAATRSGAANTLLRRDAGWFGHNTDLVAAMESLEAALAEVHGREGRAGLFSERQFVILGAGGVARTFAAGLVVRGARVTITNRSSQRADELAAAVGCAVAPWEQRDRLPGEVLINCTPVGMAPEVEACPIDPESLRPDMLVFDTIYNPERTVLVRAAVARGCRTITGVDMFVRQAAHQVRLFTGREPPLQLMRKTVEEALCGP